MTDTEFNKNIDFKIFKKKFLKDDEKKVSFSVKLIYVFNNFLLITQEPLNHFATAIPLLTQRFEVSYDTSMCLPRYIYQN